MVEATAPGHDRRSDVMFHNEGRFDNKLYNDIMQNMGELKPSSRTTAGPTTLLDSGREQCISHLGKNL